MILIFLGSWRSTLIIAVSIPLSILSSIIVLSALGETINIMTLGGLALAVGILVDDATVAIENINSHLEHGKDLEPAILDGAQQIAVPAFVSTLCICIVFVPMFFLTGVARFLFVPMAEAVVFAMAMSYILSRTLVPTLVMLLMKTDPHPGPLPGERETVGGPLPGESVAPAKAGGPSPLQRVYKAFDAQFNRVRAAYEVILDAVLHRRMVFGLGFLAFTLASCLLYPILGRDFFPAVDAGQIRLHMRVP